MTSHHEDTNHGDMTLQHVQQYAESEEYFIINPGEDDNVFTTGRETATQSDALYFCGQCGCSFDSIDSYTAAHNGAAESCSGDNGVTSEIDIIEETSPYHSDEDEAVVESMDMIEKTLWEPVDIKSDISLPDQSNNNTEKYFCYDCRCIFDDLLSAEDHVCKASTQIEVKDDVALSEQDYSLLVATNKQQIKRKVQKSSLSYTEVVCEICNTVFKSTKSLKFHMRIHAERADKSIQDALPVGAHKQYSELNQFHCEICNKSFDENLLDVHKQMHQNQEQHMCGICNRQFDNVIEFNMHLKIHDKPQESQSTKPIRQLVGKTGFPCQYCERVFARPFEKVKHERVHTGEKPYKCEVCGKTFRVSYSLTLHLRTHTNIRPYVCATCNKRFKSQQVYSLHLLSHGTERQYVCDVCSKSFRTPVQLHAHKNTHTKPYQCVICNRPFASLYAVKAHMRKHKKLESSKNKCDSCGAEYSRPFALRLHMETMHGQKLEDASELDREVSMPEENTEQQVRVADGDSAVLIAAAEADAAYINAAANDVDVVGLVPTYEDGIEVSAEFDVENFHSEEIITDWLK